MSLAHRLGDLLALYFRLKTNQRVSYLVTLMVRTEELKETERTGQEMDPNALHRTGSGVRC